MENNLKNLKQALLLKAVEALTLEQLKVIRQNLRDVDLPDEKTHEVVAEYCADGGEVNDLLPEAAKLETRTTKRVKIMAEPQNTFGAPYRGPRPFVVAVSLGTLSETAEVWAETEAEATERAKYMFASSLVSRVIATVKPEQKL
jgi:hypothetical protein